MTTVPCHPSKEFMASMQPATIGRENQMKKMGEHAQVKCPITSDNTNFRLMASGRGERTAESIHAFKCDQLQIKQILYPVQFYRYQSELTAMEFSFKPMLMLERACPRELH